MFAITSGNAEVVQNGDVIRVLGPGDVFGEVAIPAGSEYKVSGNGAERKIKADKTGVLRVPLTLSGSTNVSISK